MAGLDLDEDMQMDAVPWSNDLMDCAADFTTCMYACCCPCIASGEVYKNAELGENCIVGCLLFSCVACLYPCCITRGIRKKRHIEGSLLNDTLYCYCCCVCEITKQLREVREVRDDRGT